MGLRRLLRESAFQMARRDVAAFLTDHEEDLLRVFRDEMQRLDDEIPEEALFIDIKMVPLGEMVMKAALRTMSRFLLGNGAEAIDAAKPPGTAGTES